MIQKKLISLCCMALAIFATSCHDDDDDLIGLWTQSSTFSGTPRSQASSFTIDNKGYVVGGFEGTNRLRDLWVYDMNTQRWERMADLPDGAIARQNAVAFAANGKGYYGLGVNTQDALEINDRGYLKDFWEYDPTSNTWTQMPDFPGTPRYDALAFSVSNKGYVGFGFDDTQGLVKDLYRFDPSTKTWSGDLSAGADKRQGGNVFVIGEYAYIVGGVNNATYIYDFWRFDPSDNSWLRLRDITNNSDDDYDDDYTTIVRSHASTFVIDGCGFLVCGETSGLNTYCWKYYPETDLWENLASFKGSHRTSAVSFSTGTHGYVVTGRNGSSTWFDDMWTLDPYTYDDDN